MKLNRRQATFKHLEYPGKSAHRWANIASFEMKKKNLFLISPFCCCGEISYKKKPEQLCFLFILNVTFTLVLSDFYYFDKKKCQTYYYNKDN